MISLLRKIIIFIMENIIWKCLSSLDNATKYAWCFMPCLSRKAFIKAISNWFKILSNFTIFLLNHAFFKQSFFHARIRTNMYKYKKEFRNFTMIQLFHFNSCNFEATDAVDNFPNWPFACSRSSCYRSLQRSTIHVIYNFESVSFSFPFTN